MSRKRKQGTSIKVKIILLAIMAILIISVVASVLISNQTPVLPSPSLSSFTPAEWMSFIPASAQGFDFLNISSLYTQDSSLFQSNILINLIQPNYNITVPQVSYEVLTTFNSTYVYAYAMDSSDLSNLATALASSNLTSDTYNNVTLYQVNATGGMVWACITHGGFVLANDTSSASEAALQSVIDATSTSFFNNDSLISGYLLAWEGSSTFALTYEQASTNTYNVDWVMHSLTSTSAIDMRYVYDFPSSSVVNSEFHQDRSDLFATGSTTYTCGSFMVGDYSYPLTEISTALQYI